ncbi:MAG: hypothetical protein ABL961_16900 [Vicinamibacterales bacterium]
MAGALADVLTRELPLSAIVVELLNYLFALDSNALFFAASGADEWSAPTPASEAKVQRRAGLLWASKPDTSR